MNEEEKKAINDFKRTVELYEAKPIDKILVEFDEFDYKIVKIVLNLIEKLQKENEELKKSKITYEKVRDIQEKNKNIVDKNYISKKEIKDKIKEYKNILKTCNKSKDVERIKAINERVLELEELLEKNEEESKCTKKQENKNIEK